MADIAFLLLTFFMVTTVMSEEKGLTLLLPPLVISPPEPVNDRNLFTIQLNSLDKLMVEVNVRSDSYDLRREIKEFLLNNGRDDGLSESPRKAIVSFKADRGTSHRAFIEILDEIQAAYYEIYADRAGISAEQFRKLNMHNKDERELYDRGRHEFSMNISIAEPTDITP